MAEPMSTPIRGRLLLNEPLARYTSWRVGGPADRLFEPADRDDLIAFVKQLPPDEPLLWIGLGSNLLARDGGFRGTVIRLHGMLDALRIDRVKEEPDSRLHGNDEEVVVYAEAGVHCARVSKFVERHKRAGLGFMAGIPGTVGGALAMNAGAWGGETWSVVEAVEVLWRHGRTEWLSPSAFVIAYRSVSAPADMAGFLAARFCVTPDLDGSHARKTRESLAQRKATQPVGKPSAGSTFRNPPGDHAARLIESCGLKGFAIGGAQVSTLHSNFILTVEGARAADVEALIAHIRQVVRMRTGVELEPEIKVVGDA
jgi:UDP-N-acetylmuramate dehydrogenase